MPNTCTIHTNTYQDTCQYLYAGRKPVCWTYIVLVCIWHVLWYVLICIGMYLVYNGMYWISVQHTGFQVGCTFLRHTQSGIHCHSAIFKIQIGDKFQDLHGYARPSWFENMAVEHIFMYVKDVCKAVDVSPVNNKTLQKKQATQSWQRS